MCVLQGDSAHLFSLINIYMTFWQSALQIQQRGKAQLLVVCEKERGERREEERHLKQPEAACNALALMSSVKQINYINSITNKSNNECINLTIFTSQKVAKLLLERSMLGAGGEVGPGRLAASVAAFPMTRFVIYDLAGKQARGSQMQPEASPLPAPPPFK